jgi:hypothetical protein
MGIYTKTDAGWEELGVSGSGGGSAWGDFTTNGDEHASGTYGPDAQGRMWKWAEWNEADSYEVNLTGGQYWVLAVGGGNAGFQAGTWIDRGQPGNVNEGYWEFPANPSTPILVGKQASNNALPAAEPSFVGDRVTGFGVQGVTDWGSAATGRGGNVHADVTGYKSFITGSERQFATGVGGDDVPGRAGYNSGEQRDGCVIIATVDEDKTDYYPPGALPGVGGWATITSVWNGSGTKPNRYTYGDWVAFEWTADGELKTQAGGLVDALVVGSGYSHDSPSSGNASSAADGASVCNGLSTVDASSTISVVVGQPVSGRAAGNRSSIHSMFAAGGKAAGGNGASGSPNKNNGVKSSITGTEVEYAMGAGDQFHGWPQPTTYGSGAMDGGPSKSGVVIVRVPAAQAAGVPSDQYVDVP